MTASPALIQVSQLARRSVVRTFRQPASIVPPLVFPLFLLAVNTGGLASATKLPGFPSGSYLDFALAFAFMQGALFAVSNGGTDLARDVQTGFLNRLSLTPLRGSALLAGQLAGVAVMGIAQSVVYLVVGLVAGVDVRSGVGGALVLLVLATVIVLGFGGLGMLFALRTGSGEAVQGLFPLLFIMLFLSSMALPRHLIEQDWFRIVATINPVSYLIEGMRSLIVEGWNGEALALGFGIATVIAVLGLAGASIALRGRLTRT
jgi:ABC-2 type transport system permease protein